MKKSARSIESSQRKWRNRWWIVASGSVVEEMTPWIHRAALAAIIMSHSLCHLWNGLEDRLIRFDQIHPLHFLGFDWILLDAFKFDSIPLHWIEFSRIPFNSIRSQLHFLGLFRILLDSVGFYWVYRNGALFPGGGGGGRGRGMSWNVYGILLMILWLVERMEVEWRTEEEEPALHCAEFRWLQRVRNSGIPVEDPAVGAHKSFSRCSIASAGSHLRR